MTSKSINEAVKSVSVTDLEQAISRAVADLVKIGVEVEISSLDLSSHGMVTLSMTLGEPFLIDQDNRY
ncbi:hypothetical protein [Marinomonas spartinae]|uniref:hypothetical protein n=1 Tax=Marinomonas spartinae TaxID=1792290 RepID=UPI0018F1950D|nr:hypothetical protein [Marinomonas spartinae]MBJ7555414.1 hypothetical protein [Marinomonas spartinae]